MEGGGAGGGGPRLGVYAPDCEAAWSSIFVMLCSIKAPFLQKHPKRVWWRSATFLFVVLALHCKKVSSMPKYGHFICARFKLHHKGTNFPLNRRLFAYLTSPLHPRSRVSISDPLLLFAPLLQSPQHQPVSSGHDDHLPYCKARVDARSRRDPWLRRLYQRERAASPASPHRTGHPCRHVNLRLRGHFALEAPAAWPAAADWLLGGKHPRSAAMVARCGRQTDVPGATTFGEHANAPPYADSSRRPTAGHV